MGKNNLWKTYEDMQKMPNEENEIDFLIQLSQTRVYLPISKERLEVAFLTEGDNEYISIFTTIKEANKANKTTNEFTTMIVKDLFINMFINNYELQQSLKGIIMNPLNENIVLEKDLLMKMYKTIKNGHIIYNDNFFRDLQLVVPNHLPKDIKLQFEKLVEEETDNVLININLYKARRDLDDSFHWLVFTRFLGNRSRFVPYISEVMRNSIKPNETFEICVYFGGLDFLYTHEDTVVYKLV